MHLDIRNKIKLIKKIAPAIILFSSILRAETLVLNLTNMGKETGQIGIAIYADPKAFPENAEGSVLSEFLPLTVPQDQASLSFELMPGLYALTIFIDKNLNQKLDKNLLGAPKERFGFSKNPRIRVSAPDFLECVFEVKSNDATNLDIILKKMF